MKLLESALEVLVRVEQYKVQVETLRLQTRNSVAELESLAAEADQLLKKARTIRAELDCFDSRVH